MFEGIFEHSIPVAKAGNVSSQCNVAEHGTTQNENLFAFYRVVFANQ